MNRLRSLLRNLFRRKRAERDLDAEVRSYEAVLREENVRKGMKADEARRSARIEMGGPEQLKEEIRSARAGAWLDSLWQDVRFGVRMLRKSPGFTAIAVLTLALGIGATTAIFSVVNGILLKPLPYSEPSSLVSVQAPGSNFGNPTSYPNFFDWEAQNHVFSGMATYHTSEFTLTGAERPVHVQGLVVSSGLLQVLKATPLLGRGFEPEDDERGGDVVVLSYSLWREAFHSTPVIVGRAVALDNKAFTVIGVMPAGFQFPPNAREDLWTSVAVDRESGSNIMTGRGYDVLSVIARLKPGVSLLTAQADLDLIARRLAQQYPQSNAGQVTTKIVPEIDRVVGSVRLLLLVILAAVAGVLLIACINVANLSLARNLARQRELAVRTALGARRARLAAQLLTESVLLSLLGGAAGVLLATWGTPGLTRLAPEDLPRIEHVGMDWRVLAFAIALSLATGIVFGCVPAIQASKISLAESLKEAGHSFSRGRYSRKFRRALVVAEIALAFASLVGGGLLISSYVRLTHTNPGFDPNNLLTFSLDLPSPPYTDSSSLGFLNELLASVRSLHGVRAAAADWALPFSGDDPGAAVDIEGHAYAPGDTPVARVDAVTPGYFRAMGIPLLEGRTFGNEDDAKSLPVIIVNDAFARRYFPSESAVGRRIRPSLSAGSGTPWREIVGVVGNIKQSALTENFKPEYYFPLAQFPNFGTVVVRVDGNPLGLVPALRSVISLMDRSVPVYGVETMNGYLASSVARNRFTTLLLGIFGGLALVLAGLGIYGVVSYTVNQSKQEIGIRMALGAQSGDVLRMVIRQGALLAGAGIAFGAAGALTVTGFLRSLLFDIGPTDPATFVSVAILLVLVALLACYIPARRAMRVDPMIALRYE
jgi:predicted permease